MRLFLFFNLVVLVNVMGCHKSAPVGDQYIQLSHIQTQCSDPWPRAITDDATLQNVAHYIDSVGLYRASLSITQESAAQVCSACSCQTGKVIHVTTLNSSLLIDKYSAIGFTK